VRAHTLLTIGGANLAYGYDALNRLSTATDGGWGRDFDSTPETESKRRSKAGCRIPLKGTRVVDHADLHQVRLVHFFDGVFLFAEGGGKGADADGADGVFVVLRQKRPGSRPEGAQARAQP
jgi:hypothetical protein